MKIGIFGKRVKRSYSYSANGALQSVLVNDAVRWTYSYDSDGKLTRIEDSGQVSQLHYDNRKRFVLSYTFIRLTKFCRIKYRCKCVDFLFSYFLFLFLCRLISLGSTTYKYDKDGFLQQRGSTMFEYNSLGQLEKAYDSAAAFDVSNSYSIFFDENKAYIRFLQN